MSQKNKHIVALEKKNNDELITMIAKAKSDLFGLRMKNKVQSLKQTHQIKALRRSIARMKQYLASKNNG